MPPRDKKSTGYRYEPTVETRRLDALKLMFELADLKLTFTDISARLSSALMGQCTKSLPRYRCAGRLSLEFGNQFRKRL